MSDYQDFPASDMSARDKFTMAAMAAILANPELTNLSNFESNAGRNALAMNAMAYADAALQKLEDFK
jgi:hypothetical protein